ncbi:diguanylate cyclase [Actinoplanes sp. TBRC 11911]|uniref:sensor domain-containing diguanylate cyclase n=1 Tax=Actinoplanes sp. TBRC 11911 TaxID=2729386 RepID=UPI00145DFCE9|nr:sensor domain-containing diguanylate cyclase [Actinoplanes sp. TBRC 11911]NMO51910.1 diguanylate cyclase [Actinoplanes sp. TBRC 11911]
MPDGARRSRWLDPVLLVLAGLAVAAVPIFGLGWGGPGTNWALQTVIDVVEVVLALRLARVDAANRPARRLWLAAAAGMLLCAAGDLFQTVRAVADPDLHDPGLVQTTLITAGMAMVVVIMLFHPLGGTGRQRLRLWLDAGTVLTGVAVFLWYFALSPAFTTADPAGRYAGTVNCAVMMMLAFGLVKLALGGRAPFTRSAGAISLVGVIGIGLNASAPASAIGATHPRLSLIAQLLPCILMPVSMRLQELQRRTGFVAKAASRGHRPSRLPYLAVAATQVLLVIALTQSGPGVRVWGVAAGTVLITALVLTRQLAAFTDIERLLAQVDAGMREVREQREWFESLVRHSSDVTLVISPDGRIRYASPASSRVLGLDPAQLEGTVLADHLHPDDRADAGAQLRLRHADGSYRWLDIVGTDLSANPSVGGVVLNARDITEARALHDKLRHQATHDPLTGLANRALLEQTMPRSGTVCVLLVDLDGFKPINDRYGHHAGDQVLIAVARRLQAVSRTEGTAARLGGDEFVLMVPSMTAAAGRELASLITEVVAEPVEIDGGERVTVGASVGVAAGPARDAGRLLREADAAMYRSKASV